MTIRVWESSFASPDLWRTARIPTVLSVLVPSVDPVEKVNWGQAVEQQTAGEPSWLRESCPAWCRRPHVEDDHPDDRIHESDAVQLAAITARTDVPSVTPVAVDLVVRRVRHVDDDRDWVLIEATESASPRLRLSAESARALAQALDRQSIGD